MKNPLSGNEAASDPGVSNAPVANPVSFVPDCVLHPAQPPLSEGFQKNPVHHKPNAAYNQFDETVKTLAKLIESRMHGEWRHAAIHESDLQRIWPIDDEDRERKIAQFATQYGFRLRFYSKGMCAIFDKWPPDDRPKWRHQRQ